MKEVYLTPDMSLETRRNLVNNALAEYDTDQLLMTEIMDEEGIRIVYNNYLTLLNDMALLDAIYSLKSLKLEDNRLKVEVLITNSHRF